MKKALKILLIIFIILLIILGIAIGIGVHYVKSKLAKIQYVEIPKEEIEINEGVEEKLEGYRNIAIFGVDSRSDSYGTGTRSDCIIIASLNLATNDVKLVSVYRDTCVNIDGYGLDKITHAYSYGSAALALSTLNKNLDLNITEFVTVNFGAVVDIVNAVGGVDIEIMQNEIQHLNGYLNEIDRLEGVTTTRITSPGKQTLNGAQALAYARIRYTEGGDHKRTERIRDIIIALFNKAKTLNLTEMNKVIDTVLPKVYTNINADEIIKLAPDALKYSIKTSIGWPYEQKGDKINGIYYGVPTTLESNVVRLHQEIFGEPEYQASETVKQISQSIINKTK